MRQEGGRGDRRHWWFPGAEPQKFRPFSDQADWTWGSQETFGGGTRGRHARSRKKKKRQSVARKVTPRQTAAHGNQWEAAGRTATRTGTMFSSRSQSRASAGTQNLAGRFRDDGGPERKRSGTYACLRTREVELSFFCVSFRFRTGRADPFRGRKRARALRRWGP